MHTLICLIVVLPSLIFANLHRNLAIPYRLALLLPALCLIVYKTTALFYKSSKSFLNEKVIFHLMDVLASWFHQIVIFQNRDNFKTVLFVFIIFLCCCRVAVGTPISFDMDQRISKQSARPQKTGNNLIRTFYRRNDNAVFRFLVNSK